MAVEVVAVVLVVLVLVVLVAVKVDVVVNGHWLRSQGWENP